MQLHSTRAIPLDDCRYSACFNHDPGLGFYGGMVGKKCHQHNATKFMAMIIVTILWVVIDLVYHLAHLLAALSVILYLIYSSKCRSKYCLVFSPTIPFLLFALFQAKFAIITPALITGALLNEFAFTICYSWFFYFTDLCPFMSYDLASWRIIFQDGSAGFCRRYSSTHECWAALAGAMFLGKRKTQKSNPARITYVLLGTGLLWFGLVSTLVLH
jgi:Amt family ammonium transporter